MILIKSASIIGQVFTAKHLKYISPLLTESNEELIKRIEKLEAMETIEIIDDCYGTDLTCRFISPFMREALFQRMLFREHKKALHDSAADYIQSNHCQYDSVEQELSRMVKHMMRSEDVTTEANLSKKSQKLIVVKKVKNLLLTGAQIIKTGKLKKQGEKITKNVVM